MGPSLGIAEFILSACLGRQSKGWGDGSSERIVMTELSGALRERVTIERRLGNRDALGGAIGAYSYEGAAWAAFSPLIPADLTAADALSALPRWQVTMRKREGIDLRTRLIWRGRYLGVRGCISDPRDPARMVLTCEEKR